MPATNLTRRTPQAVPDPFAPAQLGPITLRNRIIKSATFEGRSPGALVSPELIEFHRRHAAGGLGMTTVAYCAVSPEGRTEANQLWFRPEVIPGMRKLTDAVHREGAAVSAQLGHAGPVNNEQLTKLKAISPSRQFNPLGLKFTRPATAEDLERVVEDYRRAARMSIEAGFDAVEVHLGHNYLTSSFLSPKLNRRKDKWGGSLENRARLARDILRAVRDEIGSEIAILAKLNMDDGVAGGFWVDEAVEVAQWFEADGTLDALELTAGSSLLNPMYLFKGDAPVKEFANTFPQPQKMGIHMIGSSIIREYPYTPNYLLQDALQIRAAVKTPLVALGGITDRASIGAALEQGFEFVAMARALLREPNLPLRLQQEPAAKSLCTHCNQCMPSIYYGTNCALTDEWDHLAADSAPAQAPA